MFIHRLILKADARACRIVCLRPWTETKYEPHAFPQMFLHVCVWCWAITQSCHIPTSWLNLQLQKLRWKTSHRSNHYKVFKYLWKKDSLKTNHYDLLPYQWRLQQDLSLVREQFDAFILQWWHNKQISLMQYSKILI